LDHQHLQGRVEVAGSAEEFVEARPIPRLVLHYLDAFNSILLRGEGYYGPAETERLHKLLFHGV
jgi:hypothetical protein